jgi:hypothetical protein
MNTEEKNENIDIAKIRKGRRMFCVNDDKLYIAEHDLIYSHFEWFKKMNWEAEKIIDEILRGAVKDNGDVYFYIGNDYRINDKIESIFFLHIKELSEKLNLNETSRIFGGLINTGTDTIWPPIKDYGEIGKYL